MPSRSSRRAPLRTRLVQNAIAGIPMSRRAVFDVGISLLPRAVSGCAGVLTSVLIARGLGPAALGQVALVLSVAGTAAALSDLGVDQTAIRFASRALAAGGAELHLAVLRWGLRIRLLLTTVVTGGFVALIPIINRSLWHLPDLTWLMHVSLFGGIFAAIASVPSVYFQSKRRFGMTAAVTVVQTLVGLTGFLLLAAYALWSVRSVVFVNLATSIAGSLLLIAFAPLAAMIPTRRQSAVQSNRFARGLLKCPPIPSTTRPPGAECLPEAFAFYSVLSSIVMLVTLRVDVWVLGAFVSAREIGLYSVATRLAMPLSMLQAAVLTALWPRVSLRQGLDETRGLLRTTMRCATVLLAVALLYSALVPSLVPWLFGARYAESVPLTRVLCLAYAIAIFINPWAVVGYNLNLAKTYAGIHAVSMFVTVTATLVLVPRIGAMGSALAMMVGTSTGGLFMALAIRRRVSQSRNLQKIGSFVPDDPLSAVVRAGA